jgi:ribosomal protein S18 acetylase RimI-like enzyme
LVIEPIAKAHDVSGFDCTEGWMVAHHDRDAAADMNEFLRKHALDHAKKGISRIFVLRDDESDDPLRVVAYYTTSVGHLESRDLPKIVSPRMTIPVAVLQRLAVDKQYHRKGIGSKLLVHLLIQLGRVAGEIGVYALVLEPLNDHVRGFYERFGLRTLPEDASRMYARFIDIQAWLTAHGHGKHG